MCATKHINEGEEISTSYGEYVGFVPHPSLTMDAVGAHVGRMKTAQRKQELRERYFFDCRCEACGG